MKNIISILAYTILSACSTGGGTVLPSPVGDAAVGKACREAAPDIIPATPLTAKSVWRNEGMGSAADSLEDLRMGFEQVSFTATSANIAAANALSANDINRWSQVPLSNEAGIITLAVAPRGDPRCAPFEREVAAQRNSTAPKANNDDPMKYWTDTRFPPASPEGRNWCLATLNSADTAAMRFSRTVTSSQEGLSNVSITLETITDSSGALLARRTLVRMSRPSFPIGISAVYTGCNGATIGQISEFYGPTGIALRPATAPTLINK